MSVHSDSGMNHPVVTRAILCDEHGRVLVGKRAGGHSAGKWALIGGKPEAGESLEDAVKREVMEEIGLTFESVLWMKREDPLSDPPRVWDAYYFTGTWSGSPALNPREIAEVAFIAPGTLDEFALAFDHRQILTEFFSR